MLDRAGVREAAAARVPRAGEDRAGILVVTDHVGEVATFTGSDLPMLETLAHQAGVALSNGRLLDRLREQAAQREHAATHDPLTGLPNRRRFLQEADGALGRDRRGCVVVVDLDRFREVNDALGHGVGDQVLTVVARRLRGATSPGIVLAHLGGDVFSALVPGGREAAAAWVDVIRTELSRPTVVGAVALPIEATCSSAHAPVDAQDADGLLHQAHLALSRAKERRSGYEAYVSSLDRSGPQRLALHADLRRAVDDGQLTAHFQPLIDPRSRRILSVETLARWAHPVRGHVPPDEFVPLAERSGLIWPLSILMMTQGLQILAPLRAAGLLPGIAVNLSPRLLLGPQLPEAVAAVLGEAALPAGCLTLEVPENAVMADPDRALAVFGELRVLGVRLSVDDFGTGHSSLACLKRLPVDEVKIDKMFVRNLGQDEGDQAIVRSTIALTQQLGLSVVAEGVEDEPTLAMLRDWGCDVVQGYLIGRPMPGADLTGWLRDHRTRAGAAQIPQPRSGSSAGPDPRTVAPGPTGSFTQPARSHSTASAAMPGSSRGPRA